MWFCTHAGLSRFDGHGFVNYGLEHGLAVEVVHEIAEDPSGAYWVAIWGGGGVVRFDPRTADPAGLFTPYPLGHGSSGRSTSLLIDRTGKVWVGTIRGLFARDSAAGHDAPFDPVDLDPVSAGREGVRVRDLMEDRRGNLWILTREGLVRRSPSGEMHVHPIAPAGASDQRTSAVVEDREGRIWVAHATGVTVLLPWDDPPPDARGGLATDADRTRSCIAGASGQTVQLPDAPGESCLLSVEDMPGPGQPIELFEASDGHVWVVRYHEGLTEFDGTRLRSYGEADGVGGYLVEDVGEDSAGNLWFATLDSGVLRIARTGFTAYDRADGLGYTRRARLAESRSGEIAVIAGPRVHVFDGQRFETLRLGVLEGLGHASSDMSVVLHDRTGHWWFGTRRGLFRYGTAESMRQLVGREPIESFTDRSGLPGNVVECLLEDSAGDIWIGVDAPEPVVRWERSTGTLHRYSDEQGLGAPSRPLAFAEDGAGQIWVGFVRGVARFSNGRFTRFTKDDGLTADVAVRPHVDRSGRLWLASAYGGVTRVDDPAAERPSFARLYTVAEGLATNPVICVVSDDFGRVYLGTPKGIDRLDPETGRIRHYTTADGLSTSQVVHGMRARDGALWFTSMRGVSRLVPRADPLTPPPPPVWITGIRVAGVPVPVSELGEATVSGLRLEAGENKMQIDFGSLSFAVGEEIEYRYRLGGAAEQWSAPSGLDSINFANLSPGRYRFEVRAVNSYGVESEQPASVSFRVLPPLWRQTWFLALATLALAGLAVAAHRLRVARAIDLERVRTRIATDLHDDIGSSLSYVALMSDVLRRKVSPVETDLGHSLGRIADTSRALMESMSDIVWAVNPKKDRLSDLVLRMRRFSNDVSDAGEMTVVFRAPRQETDVRLGPEVRRQVYLVFKESVNNAARHSGCSRVEVELRVDREGLALTVQDDGRGFDPGQKSEGHGLEGMQRRAAGLGGELELASQPGSGTRITLRVPRGRRRGPRRSSFLPKWIVTIRGGRR
jgi:signal transduction histidine kinase/ligand-binding sensor domain-containing protein